MSNFKYLARCAYQNGHRAPTFAPLSRQHDDLGTPSPVLGIPSSRVPFLGPRMKYLSLSQIHPPQEIVGGGSLHRRGDGRVYVCIPRRIPYRIAHCGHCESREAPGCGFICTHGGCGHSADKERGRCSGNHSRGGSHRASYDQADGRGDV